MARLSKKLRTELTEAQWHEPDPHAACEDDPCDDCRRALGLPDHCESDDCPNDAEVDSWCLPCARRHPSPFVRDAAFDLDGKRLAAVAGRLP